MCSSDLLVEDVGSGVVFVIGRHGDHHIGNVDDGLLLGLRIPEGDKDWMVLPLIFLLLLLGLLDVVGRTLLLATMAATTLQLLSRGVFGLDLVCSFSACVRLAALVYLL